MARLQEATGCEHVLSLKPCSNSLNRRPEWLQELRRVCQAGTFTANPDTLIVCAMQASQFVNLTSLHLSRSSDCQW